MNVLILHTMMGNQKNIEYGDTDGFNYGLYPVSNFTTKWEIREDKLNQLGI